VFDSDVDRADNGLMFGVSERGGDQPDCGGALEQHQRVDGAGLSDCSRRFDKRGLQCDGISCHDSSKATLTATADSVSQMDVIQIDGSTSQPSTPHEVQLNWDAPTPTSDPVVGYNVYRSTSGASNFALLSSSTDTQTSYDDTTVTSGVTYDYIVKSVDSEGVESAPSNSTSVTVP
jgi:fibronectin type 3 domain-containing protein